MQSWRISVWTQLTHSMRTYTTKRDPKKDNEQSRLDLYTHLDSGDFSKKF